MLTDSKIRSAKPLVKSYKLSDSQSLYSMVSGSTFARRPRSGCREMKQQAKENIEI